MTPRILKKSLLFIIAIILVLGLSVSFQSLLAAWTAPAANPPTCATGDAGCDAPLNVGPLIQPKSGALWLNTNGLSPYGLIVESGNVGIGTTEPSEKLEVSRGNMRIDWFGSGIIFGDSYSTNVERRQWRVLNDPVTSNSGLRFQVSSSVGGTPDTDVMFLRKDGNVGIGTTGPLSKLDVNGHIRTSGGPTFHTGWGVGTSGWETRPNDAGNTYGFNNHYGISFTAHSYYGGIRFYNQGSNTGTYPYLSDATMVMAITDGNVGIGTASPSSGLKLDVEGKVGATKYCDQNGNNCTTPTALSIKCDWTGWRYTGITKVYNNNLPYNCFDMYCNGSVVTQVKANKCYDHFF